MYNHPNTLQGSTELLKALAEHAAITGHTININTNFESHHKMVYCEITPLIYLLWQLCDVNISAIFDSLLSILI